MSESVSEIETVQKVIEKILKTQAEFRETEMLIKLKDFQGVRVRGYQHQDNYLGGDQVWYQH